MLKYLFIFLSLATANAVMGQVTFQPKQYEGTFKGLVYNTEKAIDLRLQTKGFALAFNLGTIKKYYKTRYYHIEIGSLKHPREYSQSLRYQSSYNILNNSSNFIFGKQNSLIAFRGGIGEKRYFSEKAKRRGLAVGISYEIGPSIGLQKPYYLQLIRVEDTGEDYLSIEKYSEENAELFLNVTRIYGSARFFRGLNEIKVIPGIQAKAAAHFSIGAFEEYVKAIEAGFMIDLYSQNIPILIETEALKNRPYFINLYLSLQIGKRE